MKLEEGRQMEDTPVCSLMVGDDLYCIDTQRIHEVLGVWTLQRMPLAPGYIAGVISNRGAVLTTVSLRALLGMDDLGKSNVVLVLESGGGERFALLVDRVGGVISLSGRSLEKNPGTLNARGKALFDGAHKLPEGLMVRLDAAKLCPSRLKETGVFGHRGTVRREG
jgi:purine-binding chemotaxis protein CheW